VKSPSSVRLGPLAMQILRYLSTHKDAQDTVEGIAEWWLLEQRIRHVISEVKQALSELVAQGMIVERAGRDGRVHYRLNSRVKRTVAYLLGKPSLNSGDVPFESTREESAGPR
jgi:hypothetical protein